MEDKNLVIDSNARLLYEAIQKLGWTADSGSLVDLVKRLDLGIPAEDEFAFLLSWLGKCSLVHKLDQNQFPPISRKKYQIPDLFACFVTNAGPKAVLVEIKVSKKKKLSWREDYLKRLKNYSSLIDVPILCAWKFYRLWLLVDLKCFVKAHKNYHLSFETAARNNLMSYLAGDFVYVMEPNVGLHFHLKKKHLVSKKQLNSSSREEQWVGRIEKAFFTNSKGNEVSKLPRGLWPLFISAEPVPKDHVEDDYIYHSFIIPDNSGMQFAHASLPILIDFSNKGIYKIHWRKQLEQHKFPVDFKIFSEAAKEGIEKGFVRNVLHLKPATIPSFLEDLEKTKQWIEL